jgi:hypothetical protein
VSAYIKHLSEIARSENVAVARHSLTYRFQEWYISLPEPTRVRPFSMQELEAVLKSQGRFISPVLLKLGWQRKRQWSSKGQYYRLWLPPRI